MEPILDLHPCPCWRIYQMQLRHIPSFAFPPYDLTSSKRIFPYTTTEIRTGTMKVPIRSSTHSSQNPGDGEHRLTRERGMKTERWKKRSTGGKGAGWRTSFLGIKLCIFSSLLIDQLPQDISMPNQRPAASVYSVLQERRLNQTHFSKEKL